MYSASAAAALYSTSDLFLMDQVFGEQCHATADYPDHRTPPQMSPPVEDQPFAFRDPIPIFGSDHMFSSSSAVSEDSALLMVVAEAPRRGSEDEISSAAIRARIASHPLYPKLLESYIDCQKVGAPPEIGNLLDEISKENNLRDRSSVSSCLGTDPELDQFMENYCDVLVKYKSDLAKPFEEATSFLNDIETQLGDLCSGASRNSVSDEAVESSGDDCSGEESQVQECCGKSEGRELKDKLLLRYSGYIGSLKHEFSKKKKKGKLPKEARQILLDWWTVHYKWPYPTEVDKVALAESTGLDQKQINNWFINQRKRHWKPSESMQFAVMDSLYEPFIVNDQ